MARPLINPDFSAVKPGASVQVDIVANDQDQGTGLNRAGAKITRQPTHGGAVINNGIITYTPRAGHIGFDIVGYQVPDTAGNFSFTGYLTILTSDDVVEPPPPPPPEDVYGFFDTNYAAHMPRNAASKGAKVEWFDQTLPSDPAKRGRGGVRLYAGNTGDDAAIVRLYSFVAAPEGNMEMNFTFKQLDNNGPVNNEGIFFLPIIRYKGTVAGVPARPADWAETEYQNYGTVIDCSDVIYRDKGKGYRPSFANNALAGSGTNSQFCRMRTYEGPGDTQINQQSPANAQEGDFPFDPLVEYHVNIKRLGTQVSVKRTRIGNTADTATFVFDDAALGPSGLGVGGWLGWAVARGRQVELKPYLDFPVCKSLDVVTPTGDYIYFDKPNISGKTALATTAGNLGGNVGGVDYARQYIDLGGATVSSRFTVTRGGTKSHPLVIRNGKFSNGVVINAEWVWLYECEIDDGGQWDRAGVDFNKSHCFGTRNLVTCARGYRVASNNPPIEDLHWNYNEFSGHTFGPSGNDNEEGQCWLSCGNDQSVVPRKVRIGWNLFTQDQANGGTETHCIYSGPGNGANASRYEPKVMNSIGTTIEFNLFLSTRTRKIYLKHGVDMVRYNHIVNATAWNNDAPSSGGALQMMSTRGQNNVGTKFHYNRVQGGQQVGCQSWDHEFIGNVLSHGCEFVCFVHCDNPSNPKTLLGGNNAKYIGNTGPLTLGAVRASTGFSVMTSCTECQGKLKGVVISDHTGSIDDNNGNSISWSSGGKPTSGPNMNYNSILNYDRGAPGTKPAQPASIFGGDGCPTYSRATHGRNAPAGRVYDPNVTA